MTVKLPGVANEVTVTPERSVYFGTTDGVLTDQLRAFYADKSVDSSFYRALDRQLHVDLNKPRLMFSPSEPETQTKREVFRQAEANFYGVDPMLARLATLLGIPTIHLAYLNATIPDQWTTTGVIIKVQYKVQGVADTYQTLFANFSVPVIWLHKFYDAVDVDVRAYSSINVVLGYAGADTTVTLRGPHDTYSLYEIDTQSPLAVLARNRFFPGGTLSQYYYHRPLNYLYNSLPVGNVHAHGVSPALSHLTFEDTTFTDVTAAEFTVSLPQLANGLEFAYRNNAAGRAEVANLVAQLRAKNGTFVSILRYRDLKNPPDIFATGPIKEAIDDANDPDDVRLMKVGGKTLTYWRSVILGKNPRNMFLRTIDVRRMTDAQESGQQVGLVRFARLDRTNGIYVLNDSLGPVTTNGAVAVTFGTGVTAADLSAAATELGVTLVEKTPDRVHSALGDSAKAFEDVAIEYQWLHSVIAEANQNYEMAVATFIMATAASHQPMAGLF